MKLGYYLGTKTKLLILHYYLEFRSTLHPKVAYWLVNCSHQIIKYYLNIFIIFLYSIHY